MTFDESVTRLRDSLFVNLYGKIDNHVYHKLDRLVRLIKKTHQDEMDEQYMKAFNLGLEAGDGIAKEIYSNKEEVFK